MGTWSQVRSRAISFRSKAEFIKSSKKSAEMKRKIKDRLEQSWQRCSAPAVRPEETLKNGWQHSVHLGDAPYGKASRECHTAELTNWGTSADPTWLRNGDLREMRPRVRQSIFS